MPERRNAGPIKKSAPRPAVVKGPTRSTATPPSRSLPAGRISEISRLAGNKAVTELARSSGAGADTEVQRVEVNEGLKYETIYENPNLSPGGVPIVSPTAKQKQFDATSYVMRPKYSMTRSPSAVEVKVRIQFVDQARGQNQWMKKGGKFLTDKAGKKVADPTYRRNVGPITQIKDAARIKFANSQCAAIGNIWSGNYNLQGKEKQVFGGALDSVPLIGSAVRPSATPIKLPLKFTAVPVFSPSATNVHTTVRLYGMGVVANRAGAHPIDAGHWYMDTKKNYAGMNLTTISAHEYGHLLGLHDEYSRSTDQAHQQLHMMGGEARKSHKKLDAHTTRQMVTMAMYPAIVAEMQANLAKVDAVILSAESLLTRQLTRALRRTWRNASVRDPMVADILPALKHNAPKRALSRVVRFQTGTNLSNWSMAKGAMGGFAAAEIDKAVNQEMLRWRQAVLRERFEAKGADGNITKFSANYSANFRQAAKATAGTKAEAMAKGIVGASVGVPTVPVSPTLVSELEALPGHWKTPGKGLDAAYTPALASTQVSNSIKSAVAAGMFTPVKRSGQLYRPIYNLVQKAATKSAEQAVIDFVNTEVGGKIQGHLATVRAAIDNEIEAALGMSAGGVAAKSADPNMKAVAQSYLTKLQAQQNKKQWKSAAIINPGGSGAGVDVKYTASSIMGNNNTAKSGFRTDMINPVVAQFNARLRRFNEDNFVAKKA